MDWSLLFFFESFCIAFDLICAILKAFNVTSYIYYRHIWYEALA